MRLTINRGHRGIAVQRQDRGVWFLDIRRQPGPQVTRRKYSPDRQSIRIVEFDDLTRRGSTNGRPSGQMHQGGSRRHWDQPFGCAHIPAAASGGLEFRMDADLPIAARVEQAVHDVYVNPLF